MMRGPKRNQPISRQRAVGGQTYATVLCRSRPVLWPLNRHARRLSTGCAQNASWMCFKNSLTNPVPTDFAEKTTQILADAATSKKHNLFAAYLEFGQVHTTANWPRPQDGKLGGPPGYACHRFGYGVLPKAYLLNNPRPCLDQESR
jgi:hypothetical protein